MGNRDYIKYQGEDGQTNTLCNIEHIYEGYNKKKILIGIFHLLFFSKKIYFKPILLSVILYCGVGYSRGTFGNEGHKLSGAVEPPLSHHFPYLQLSISLTSTLS